MLNFKIYSRRFKNMSLYQIEKTDNGWDINFIALGGQCNKNGSPFLFEILEHDNINYPKQLGEYLEYLWDVVDSDGMSNKDIQKHLDYLAKWCSEVEFKTPKTKFWKGIN